MKSLLAAFFIFAGFIMMAGSANDCDGACMEQANTIGEMLAISFMGLVMIGVGAIIAIKEANNV